MNSFPLFKYLIIALLSISTMSFTELVYAVDPYEFQIYGYATQGKGELDPELLSSYIAVGHTTPDGGMSSPNSVSQSMQRYAIELEYGLTDRVDFAYYLNLARPDAQDLQYAGSKFRFRGRFAEAGVLPADFGWYAEMEWWHQHFNDDQLEGEFMATLQKDIGKWTVIVNAPDVEKVVIGTNRKEVFEIGWRGEVSYQAMEKTRIGIQIYGSPGKVNDVTPVGQQQHYIVPTIHTPLFNTMKASLGLGFGLTEGSDLFFLKANLHFDGNVSQRIYD